MILDTPLIDNKKIALAEVPQNLQFLANGRENNIYKLTITPRKTCNKLCRATVIMPANLRTGNFILQNGGRTPVTAPPIDVDDLRPYVYYVFGTGTQVYKVFCHDDLSVFKQGSITF